MHQKKLAKNYERFCRETGQEEVGQKKKCSFLQFSNDFLILTGRVKITLFWISKLLENELGLPTSFSNYFSDKYVLENHRHSNKPEMLLKLHNRFHWIK